MSDSSKQGPEKIAVLGGGLSSLSSVFHLTSQPGWEKKYDITVFQTGWRLGGKGASGRDRNNADRIEEHGLHVWFGFYQNAFRMLRSCYEANNRPPGKGFSVIEEAFEPSHSCVNLEMINGEWKPWVLQFPPNDRLPGGDSPVPTPMEIIEALVEQLMEAVLLSQFAPATGSSPFSDEENDLIREMHASVNKFLSRMSFFFGLNFTDLDGPGQLESVRKRIKEMKRKRDFLPLLLAIEKGREWFWENIQDRITDLPNIRKLWIISDIICSVITGLIKDKVIFEGYEAINHYDLREWLKKHALTPELTAENNLIQMLYSIVFAGYKQNTFEAGTALQGTLRSMAYNGAYYYRMNAGMGDVVFGPMYEVLRKRGVKFRFFHKVTNIGLSADKKRAESISIDIQAHTKSGEYEPLYPVKDLPCWPNAPFFEQLKEGKTLEEKNINLEAEANGWTAQQKIQLNLKIDFDRVILGIPVSALPHVCPELVNANSRLKASTEKVTTTATHALQVWLKPDIAGLGFPFRNFGRPLWGPYHQPFDTNADLSNLILRENWPAHLQPGCISYFCGKLDYQLSGDLKKDQIEGLKSVRMHIEKLIQEGGPVFWPRLADEKGNIRWELFIDKEERAGEKRLEGQYFRANTDPGELFTLSEKGSSAYRLRADESGFENVVLAGDWTKTGLNVGCVEASVMSGMMASRAICGFPENIPGEKYELLSPPNESGKMMRGIEETVAPRLCTMFKAILS